MDLEELASGSDEEEDFSKALEADDEAQYAQATLPTTSRPSGTLPASGKSSRDEDTSTSTGKQTQPSLQTSSEAAALQVQEGGGGSRGVESKPETSCEASSSSSSSSSSPPPLSRIGLNSHKAGMEGLDKTRINQIILEASKGSKYYENEVQKEKRVTEKINKMLEELSKITPAQKTAALLMADKTVETLELSRDLSRVIVHVDMDAFYAAVEMKDNPALRDVPMAVGSSHMLSTSNYVARRFGVRAAMPGFIAKKLCPKLVIVPTHFGRYREVSQQVQGVLSLFDPEFSPVGLDESYLDITELVVRRLSESEAKGEETKQKDGGESAANSGLSDATSDGDTIDIVERTAHTQSGVPEASSRGAGLPAPAAAMKTLPLSHWECAGVIVEELRAAIHERTGLTASAGIAPNKMLAKIASDMNKPNGQFFVTPTREGVLDFVQKLPIRKICGIGKVTERMLNALGVSTCRDLYEKRAVLQLLFSATSSHYFNSISLGISSSRVHREYERKSISTERTFSEISAPEELLAKCQELCQALARDMHKEKLKGRTVTVKLKTVHFEVKSHATTLPQAVGTAEEIYRAASQLLMTEITSRGASPLRLRLMGVRVSSLQSGGGGGTGKKEKLTEFFPSPNKACTSDGGQGSSSSSTPHLLDKPSSSSVDSAASPQPSKKLKTSSLPVEATPSTEPRADSAQASQSSFLEDSLFSAECPVCTATVRCLDNATFNKHIDECLNRPAIVEAVKAAAGAAASLVVTPTKKIGGAGALHCKRMHSPLNKGASSRKRNASSISGHLDYQASPSKRRTLDHFWK